MYKRVPCQITFGPFIQLVAKVHLFSLYREKDLDIDLHIPQHFSVAVQIMSRGNGRHNLNVSMPIIPLDVTNQEHSLCIVYCFLFPPFLEVNRIQEFETINGVPALKIKWSLSPRGPLQQLQKKVNHPCIVTENNLRESYLLNLHICWDAFLFPLFHVTA